ncbi:MAG: beta-ketoacyl synthase chain length factor [Bacteroidota bacterium]
MLYIHQHTCISPQQTFDNIDIDTLNECVDNKLKAKEPAYDGIPHGSLRRMGKAVRMGVGAAIPIIKSNPSINGIIIGTANGGMEDCIKFLNQIIDYDEGMLTPGNFVQSTPNAIAAQIGLMSRNKFYNITHVHRGLAFEDALIDAAMMIKENPGNSYLLGAVDEISTYNYNIDFLDGWYKKEHISNKDLYSSQSPASIAGEGAAMFLVNDNPDGAVAMVKAIKTLHTEDENFVKGQLKLFIESNFSKDEAPDLLITGENGDARLLKYYEACEAIAGNEIIVARYKHLSGEYPTTTSFAFWLACRILQEQRLPRHLVKKGNNQQGFENILLYNSYKGKQHVFAIVAKPSINPTK